MLDPFGTGDMKARAARALASSTVVRKQPARVAVPPKRNSSTIHHNRQRRLVLPSKLFNRSESLMANLLPEACDQMTSRLMQLLLWLMVVGVGVNLYVVCPAVERNVLSHWWTDTVVPCHHFGYVGHAPVLDEQQHQ
uniref:Uncharacterized protein n=1 Tax=Anopheles minimus TaxID=112268 RepID=A0A182WM83_9DIPT